MPHGQGRRCTGFLSSDQRYFHCSNDRYANGLPLQHSDGGDDTYAHLLGGPCHCGVTHIEKSNGAGHRPTPRPLGSPLGTPQSAIGRPSQQSTPPPKIVATYDYTDPHTNALRFQVVRLEPKSFRQRRPCPNCEQKGCPACKHGWIWNLEGVHKDILFRQYELSQLIREGKLTQIWIAEGEKDVLAFLEHGVYATCSAGGAGKWPEDAGHALCADLDVTIVQDKDEKGKAHAQLVKAALGGVARSVRIVEAREGKDAADHFAAGFGVDDFQEANRTPLQLALAESSVARFRGKAEPLDWIIGDLMPEHTTILMVGPGGAGKGHIIQQMGHSLATALPFGPWSVPRRRGMLYLSLEDDERRLHLRYQAAQQAFWKSRVPPDELAMVERYFHQVPLVGLGIRMGDELADALAERVQLIPDCALIVLDPLTLGLPEMQHSLNTQEGAAEVHRAANTIRRRTGCAVMLVHHVGKAAQRGGTEMDQTAATGSKQLVDLSRSVVQLRGLDESDIAQRGLEQHRQYIEVGTSKINDAPVTLETAIWRRDGQGALTYIVSRPIRDVERDRALEALAAIQPATRSTWEKACNEAGLSKHKARAARQALLAANRVRRVPGQRGQSATADLFEVNA